MKKARQELKNVGGGNLSQTISNHTERTSNGRHKAGVDSFPSRGKKKS